MKRLLLLPFLLLLSCQDNAPKPDPDPEPVALLQKKELEGTWLRGGYIEWKFYNNRVEPALHTVQLLENMVQEYRFTGDSVAIAFSDGSAGTFAYKLSTKGRKHYVQVRDGLKKDSQSDFEIVRLEGNVMEWKAKYKQEKTYLINGYEYRTDSSSVAMVWQRVK